MTQRVIVAPGNAAAELGRVAAALTVEESTGVTLEPCRRGCSTSSFALATRNCSVRTGETLPATSVWRTSKVCLPSLSLS